jgi:hypothetical protein
VTLSLANLDLGGIDNERDKNERLYKRMSITTRKTTQIINN